MKIKAQGGFSLLELMAVILVIGMGLAMVSLTMRGGEPEEEIWNTIEQFMGLAQFASERAILSGETSALFLEPPEWQVQRGQSVDEIGWRYSWITSSSEGWQKNAERAHRHPAAHCSTDGGDQRNAVGLRIPGGSHHPCDGLLPVGGNHSHSHRNHRPAHPRVQPAH
ncbi:MAG: type II secretion system GspH family protein [Cellvibrionaceae bacterium]|nr:type II secretion system GspH family protein [Cellvibrionaceae bacterium]